MRILVCGGRNFDDWRKTVSWMEHVCGKYRGINRDITVIEGGATGADFLGRVYAKWVGFNVETHPADWKKYGKGAGPIRNQQMLDEGKPDVVVAFPGGTGTADMVAKAKKAGVKVIEVPT